MLKRSPCRRSILLNPKLIIYKLFSHRFTVVFFAVATSQMILQLWLEGRGFVINNQGAKLLFEILSTSNHPELPATPIVSPQSAVRRSLYARTLVPAPRSLPITKRQLASREDRPIAQNKTAPPAPPTPPKNITSAKKHKPENQNPKPPNKPKPPPKAPEHKKPAPKSTQTRLKDAERDPTAAQILQRLNGQDGVITTAVPVQSENSTANAAPGAAIFILDGNLINLSAKCVAAFNNPLKSIDHSHRTNIAMMAFQIWVWGLTIWGLLSESVPHLAAVAAIHVLITAFAGVDLRERLALSEFFKTAVLDECDGINVIPSFWTSLTRLNIVSLVFTACTVLALSILGYRLYSILDWRTFKKLGASRRLRLAHTFSLVFAVMLYLIAYFVTIFLALWADELLTPKWHQTSSSLQNSTSIKASLGVLLGLLIPWLFLGNWSLNNENRYGVIVFAGFNLLLITLKILLLSGGIYQNVTQDWVFLKFTGIVACILLFTSFLIAVGSVWVFDKGLIKQAHRNSRESSDSLGKPSMNDDEREASIPRNEVKPYCYEPTDMSITSLPDEKSMYSSGVERLSLAYGSHRSSRSPTHDIVFDTSQRDDSPSSKFPERFERHAEVRQSWVRGDEKNLLRSVPEKATCRKDRPPSTASSGNCSYASTTISYYKHLPKT